VSHCCGIQAGSYNRLAEGVPIVPGVDIVSVTYMAIYYSFSSGHDEYQEVTNRGIWQQKSNSPK